MDYKAEQCKRMKMIIYEFDAENRNCADCSKPDVEYASINNGTVICAGCAEAHKSFGTSLSFLKHFSERWDDYLLSYVKMGSNSRFIQFVKTYRINSIEIALKYKTRASEYYRELLRSEVMGFDPPEGIDIRSAGEILKDFEDNFPEFFNYSYVKHVDLDNLVKKSVKIKEEDEKGLFSAVTSFFGNFSSKIDDAAEYMAEKVAAGMNASDKYIEEGSKAIDNMKSVVNENTKKLQGFINEIINDDDDKNKEKEQQTNDFEKKEEEQHDDKKEEENKEQKIETNKTEAVNNYEIISIAMPIETIPIITIEEDRLDDNITPTNEES